MTAIKSPVHRAFFGDKDYDFSLAPELIDELERLTGCGVGKLCKRFFAGDFGFREVLNIIRLGLIGGGETPKAAASLVAAYGERRPIMETYPLAVAILETLALGKATNTEEEG
ncbi:gene transfer agent family protein [Methylocystis heyeri]|uniref:Gene transfer agent family protein n=1 Tax=Methylocystis heyeri TaxID=391905 RepID=A0A6B8KJA6_9HYPH|nr:gene transfer agent family protein [Methylocystis heyeri]QGM46650.1 gene transfer agent family protein [Methylocystis heyeri]